MKKEKELIKCPSCRGKKQILGLGLKLVDCADCKGIGFKEKIGDEISYLESKTHIVHDLRSIGNEMKERKKRSRGRYSKLREKYT